MPDTELTQAIQSSLRVIELITMELQDLAQDDVDHITLQERLKTCKELQRRLAKVDAILERKTANAKT